MKIKTDITRNMLGLYGKQDEIQLNKGKEVELVKQLPKEGFYLNALICWDKKEYWPIRNPQYIWIHEGWLE